MLFRIHHALRFRVQWLAVALILFTVPPGLFEASATAQTNGVTSNDADIQETMVPSPLLGLKVKDAHLPRLKLAQLVEASENHAQSKVVIEVRTLKLLEGQQLNITEFIKPGSFEVFMGAIPKIENLATDLNNESKLFSSAEIKTAKSTTRFAFAAETSHRPQTTILAKLDSSGVESLTRLAATTPSIDMVQSPTSKGFSGEVSTCSEFAQRPFVVGVKPKVQGARVAYQPKIQLIEDGIVFQFLPAVKGDQISLKADILLMKVVGVDQQVLPALGVGNEPMTIQIPEQKVSSVHLDSVLKNGETLYVDPHHEQMVEFDKKSMLGKRKKLSVNERICYLVTARIVDANATVKQSQFTHSNENLK
jgi:hypothetical protein